VADHSRFRTEPFRRLSRTGSFVAATTYASTPVAEAIIEVVHRMHERVQGTAPDGRPYAANDPDLLRWVHVTEVTSFLRAHRRYHPFPLRGSDLDRYYDETAVVAEKLGATAVPRSRSEMSAYLKGIRPELVAGTHAREMLAFLRQPMDRDPVTRFTHGLFIEAAIGLMPGWAQELHGVRRGPIDDLRVRPLTWTVLEGLRLALGRSPVLDAATRRAAG
jgi:uncharacterized protein (DUF2236 family)